MPPKCPPQCGGGLLARVGGWKTGLVIVCSCGCMAGVVTVTSPNVNLRPWQDGSADDHNSGQQGWIGADDGYAQLSCSMWYCLRITRIAPSTGGYKNRGTWEWQDITDTFSDCTDLKAHVEAFQAFGVLMFITITWSFFNHLLNIFSDCLVRLQKHLFIFHFIDAFLALITFSLMAAAYNQDLCGDSGVALKDYRIGDSQLQLGMVVFGNTVLIFFTSMLIGFLLLYGAYKPQAAPVQPAAVPPPPTKPEVAALVPAAAPAEKKPSIAGAPPIAAPAEHPPAAVALAPENTKQPEKAESEKALLAD